ncbi:MAG TPA: dTDP-4-dehydrorhamnose 3,5-epimerase [Anaerolineae bacterium]|nr:dTDP-4-dehydrorhamnose 3,5-epimerase [Anaerolineae bacterium]HMR62504.1 dTDP-4-dehydrorhamnose 3,5-epimerase [Anaerolineae bacterium]
MIFSKTKLENAFIIDIEKFEDPRGFFARGYCQREFEAHGLVFNTIQANISRSLKKGTLRGMHYQVAPYAEAKLVRCIRGALYDVIIDLRPESSTYLQWLEVELTEDNYRMLYVPEGFAHGFQTLVDNTEAFYQVSQFFTPQAEGGIRYNDPVFKIDWPLEISVISQKDQNWPDFMPRR